jgi:cation diffusion facilitator CzcD-associated flavoprotein CzcO
LITDQIPGSLYELEDRLATDLLWLDRPVRAWVPPRVVGDREILDVAVVGAGINGLATMAALQAHGIHRVRAFDRSAAGREGPWSTYARMRTLRTAKELPGLALGIPSLTFRAWFEAQFGRAAFEAMTAIPTAQWMEYLVWYRRVLKLDVLNNAEITWIGRGGAGLLALHCQTPTERRVEYARRIVIATGLDGLGAPYLPPVAQNVSSRFRAHSSDIFDPSTLRGLRVAVVGSGASAMDNAAAALEAGAAQVDLFVRRPSLEKVDKLAGISSFGSRIGYPGLADADRWEIMNEASKATTAAPQHSIQRVSAWANARFHLVSPVLDMTEALDTVTLTTPNGRYEVDFVIFATGFGIDYDQRPEFSEVTRRAFKWGEAYVPPAAQANETLALSPYLGGSFEFIPRPGNSDDSWISSVHCFCGASLLSQGKTTSGIPSLTEGVTTLVRGLVRSLFIEDRNIWLERFHSFGGFGTGLEA